MLMKIFCVDNIEYCFDAEKFANSLKGFANIKKKKIKEVEKQIADICYTSMDNVKRWKMGKHSPGDLDRIKIIAKFLEIDVMDLL